MTITDINLVEPGDMLEVNESTTNEGILSPGDRAVVRVADDASGGVLVEWLGETDVVGGLDGPWSHRRFNPAEILVGRAVRSTGGVSAMPAGHLGLVEGLSGTAVGVRWGTRNNDLRWVSRDTIRVIDERHYSQRVLDFTVETVGTSAEEPDGVEEWQKKWTDLVLATHRIANDHDMCSSFEQSVYDLGIPPRHRYRDEVDFDHQGFETPDLEIDETGEEVEYCVEVSRAVQVTIPITVDVTQHGHAHYTGPDGPSDVEDIDWDFVEWSDVDDEAIAQAVYDTPRSWIASALDLSEISEEPSDGSEEIDNYEVSQ